MGKPLPSLNSTRVPLASASAQRKLLDELSLPAFDQALQQAGLWPLKRNAVEVLQLNLGKLCNQTCRHCHVDAGPDRTEVMTRQTMQECLDALDRTGIETVDITGGAPELVPHYRWLVQRCRELGRRVMTRCNLTVLESRKYHDLPQFYARHQVEVVASLPHYRALNTDKQRGIGVFERSISALRRLNEVGYGHQAELRLALVTNPVGAFLPRSERSLERQWRQALRRDHGVEFTTLFAITNMPIARYLQWLLDSDNLESYMLRLANAFNPAAARGVMCRNTISVGWDGTLYDCDFNQMLELKLMAGGCDHIRDLDVDTLSQGSIRVAAHCFGCTAGSGSSCGGSTA